MTNQPTTPQKDDDDDSRDALKRELQEERRENKELRQKINSMQSANVKLQMEVESEEEQITNRLMGRLSMLSQEKKKLELKVQATEAQLEQMTRELSTQKRSTQELQEQIKDVNSEKSKLEDKLLQDRTSLMNQISQTLENMTQSIDSLSAKESELASSLRAQLAALGDAHTKFARERQSLRNQNEQMRDKLSQIENENFLLAQRYKREQEKQREMMLTSLRSEMDDELLMERAFTTQRMRSSSNVSSTSSHGEKSPVIPSLGVETPGSQSRRASSSFFRLQLESPRSATSSEPSPLQQLMNNNYTEPLSATTSPRLTPHVRSPPAMKLSVSAPQTSFMDRYLAHRHEQA